MEKEMCTYLRKGKGRRSFVDVHVHAVGVTYGKVGILFSEAALGDTYLRYCTLANSSLVGRTRYWEIMLSKI